MTEVIAFLPSSKSAMISAVTTNEGFGGAWRSDVVIWPSQSSITSVWLIVQLALSRITYLEPETAI
jgi:hypothetical protein